MVDAVRPPGAGPAASRPSDRTSPTPSCASSTRQASGACGSTSSGAWSTPHPPTSSRPSRSGSRRSAGTSSSTSRPPTCRSWRTSSAPCPRRSWSTTWAAPTSPSPVDGPEFARFLRFVERNDVWVKVSCPERLTVTGPPALDGEQNAYTDVVPFARRSWRSSRTGCCGAPTGPTPTSPTTCPTTGSWSTTCRTSPSRPNSARSSWSTTPCACTGPTRRLPLTRRPHSLQRPKEPRHAALQCGEPARPACRSPGSTRSCWSRCRSRTSSSSPTSTASPPRPPS